VNRSQRGTKKERWIEGLWRSSWKQRGSHDVPHHTSLDAVWFKGGAEGTIKLGRNGRGGGGCGPPVPCHYSAVVQVTSHTVIRGITSIERGWKGGGSPVWRFMRSHVSYGFN